MEKPLQILYCQKQSGIKWRYTYLFLPNKIERYSMYLLIERYIQFWRTSKELIFTYFHNELWQYFCESRSYLEMVAELLYRHRVLLVTPLDQHSCIVIGISHLRYITLLYALHIYDKFIGQNTKMLLLVGYLPLYLSFQEITRTSNKLGAFWCFS